jgi:hypothetical protein
MENAQLHEIHDRVIAEVENGFAESWAWPFMSELLWHRHTMGKELPGKKYRNYYHLVYELGELKRSPVIVPDDPGFLTMEVGECFLNAYHGAVDMNLTYVEGYAKTDAFLVPHAWLEDMDGQIIDPTWAHLDLDPNFQITYYGVPFSTTLLIERATVTGWCSILGSDWRAHAPILWNGLVVEQGVATAIGEPHEQ